MIETYVQCDTVTGTPDMNCVLRWDALVVNLQLLRLKSAFNILSQKKGSSAQRSAGTLKEPLIILLRIFVYAVDP